jgi:hypothetical protein
LWWSLLAFRVMVVAAFAAPFVEALAGFEPAYPARNPIAKGAGLTTSLQRPNEKSQQPCAFGAFRCWLFCFTGRIVHPYYYTVNKIIGKNHLHQVKFLVK